MPLRQEKYQIRPALFRWSLVLALHAALLWAGIKLLNPPKIIACDERPLISVRLISEKAVQPRLDLRRTVKAMLGSAQPQQARAPLPPVQAQTQAPPPVSQATAVAAAEPASAAASAVALNLDAATISHAIRSAQAGPATARTLARGTGTESELQTPTKDQMAEAIKKTERRDCRHAYGGAGLLALIPLAISAVTDTGCKW